MNFFAISLLAASSLSVGTVDAWTSRSAPLLFLSRQKQHVDTHKQQQRLDNDEFYFPSKTSLNYGPNTMRAAIAVKTKRISTTTLSLSSSSSSSSSSSLSVEDISTNIVPASKTTVKQQDQEDQQQPQQMMHPMPSASAQQQEKGGVDFFSSFGGASLSSFSSSTLDVAENSNNNKQQDNRPFVQRTQGPRPARRLNHGFKHLYRHNDNVVVDDNDDNDRTNDDDDNDDDDDALHYLQSFGLSNDDILAMNASFPPLLSLSVKRHLQPKMRFLRESIFAASEDDNIDDHDDDQKQHTWLLNIIRACPQYFGARLERTIAPRHAFLVYLGLPHGRELVQRYRNSTTTTTATNKKEQQQSANDYNSNDGRKQQQRRQRRQQQLQRQDDGILWEEFLISCRTTKRFVAFCQKWQRQRRRQEQQQETAMISSQQVEAFDFLFARGLMAAARNELVQANATWNPLEYCQITSSDLVGLLVQHGANPYERDHRGATLLHWAAGTGNLAVFQELQSYFEKTEQHKQRNKNNKKKKQLDNTSSIPVILSPAATIRTTRDGATPLHWASAGTTAREFGVGGHVYVCRHLLFDCFLSSSSFGDGDADWPTPRQQQQEQQKQRTNYANQVTYDGNSALMWASWSGSIDTVRLLAEQASATASTQNRNGCTVAHWASSGGNLTVCQYLNEAMGVDFSVPNFGGNTPLTHAVAFGRAEVVEWLLRLLQQQQQQKEGSKISAVPTQMSQRQSSGSSSSHTADSEFTISSSEESMVVAVAPADEVALNLAQEFVKWTDGEDERRAKVLRAFQEWYQEDETVFHDASATATSNDYGILADTSSSSTEENETAWLY